MNDLFRIIDANINRASEGIRVLEDIARFYYSNASLTEKLKKLRHEIRKNLAEYLPQCISERDASDDIGLLVSGSLNVDGRSTLFDMISANFKRCQEALRVIEENLKLVGKYQLSKLYERLRFECYTLEKEYIEADWALKKRKKLDTDIYCITAEEYSRGRTNIEVVAQMIEAGIKIIQYREKDKKLIDKYRECLQIREMTQKAGVTFIVNDHVDLALMVGADGVHIGQDDLPVEKVRELVGERMIIGVSTHSPEQAQKAVAGGADYIGVGPIYRTFTKKDVCQPVGLEYLEYVAQNIDIPFVAIGGIKEHNVLEVKRAGAKCIAMVTEIVGADDIKAKIESIRRRLTW
ncbi:thiamine-phosphate pyrophosphorylase [Caldicoprobacter guelmensis]|uniref:thiamine phosphate synthase n=1 Tax=Caldicoprobacter guelmensis TaxID=1170224 RepID=UPI0019596CA5|nr:thiamine-phosphate pyrophosphorylase [Caldicoprobacter guelmensis]